MSYIKLPDTYPYSDRQLRSDNPQTSFPTTLTAELRAEYGVHPVTPTVRPAHDKWTQRVVELPPAEVNGVWTQQWQVQALSTEEQTAQVPQAVTRRQAKQALLGAGVLSAVQPAIDAIQDPTQRALVQIEWDDSQVFERQRPALLGLASALGLSSAQLDQLFITASAL